MLRIAFRGGLSVLILFISLYSYSQFTYPKTLLWRITGNGLSKPSYLYGTMHLQDKRLFQFGDSLYHAIENTEGLAIEVDFKEAIDSVFRNGLRTAEEEAYLRKTKVKINRSKLGKTGDSLLRNMGIKGDVITKKQLKEIRTRRMNQLLKQGEMPTIMDAYLLGLAMRQGKWTGGIEDVADQLNLSDEIGGALNPENVLVEEKLMKSSLEQMIALYLSQDITKLEESSNGGFSEADKDTMLINRNIKMAFRMDSLSHVRAMFFAVGAAHLAGDSGVIQLLLHKGFHVEPVFSSSTLSAEIYASKLKEIEWTDVNGDDSTYTIKMPGQPSDYDMFGEAFKMKMFFDITTMTFYMTGSVTGPKAGAGALDTMAKNMIENMAGKHSGAKTKKILENGLEGREITTENSDGSYKIRVLLKYKTVFFLFIGGMKESSITGSNSEKFFASFKAGDKSVKPVDWVVFSLPEKAFSVSMPGKATLNKPDDNPDSEWKTISYSSIDALKGMYYMIQIGDISEGSYLDGDSVYLERIVNGLRENMDTGVVAEFTTYKSFPAVKAQLYYKEADANYKILHVVRGNRRYMLLAGAQKDVDLAAADPFFNSFELLPYLQTTTSLQAKDGFSTTTPGSFVQTPADTTSPMVYQADYYVSNKTDGISYEVFKRTFSDIYWKKNDTTYYNSKLTDYKTDEDSLVKKTWVQNGSLKGVDVEIAMPGYNSIKKVRLLVNKDTLYTLFAMIPKQYINEKHHQDFFNDFKITNEAAPTIYTSKASQLLQALHSNDSARFAEASENLELVSFSKKDLPLLHNALLTNYQDSTEDYSASVKLADIIAEFADSSTIDFVEKNYPLLKKGKENLQYDLLTLLAKQKTTESYSLLKRFLLQPLPQSGYVGPLQSVLGDSLLLTSSLFPEILQQAADTLFGYSLISVATQLLDSGLITKENLMPYSKQLMAGARNAATKINNDEDQEWKFSEWAALLTWLNTTEGNAILKNAVKAKDAYLKQQVIIAMLKNGLTVSAADITKVAADKTQRRYFYEALLEIKKQNLFPAIYATQKSIAESDLFAYLTDEYDEIDMMTYIGERVEMFEGKKKLFYLFKVRMMYDDENKKQNFLGIAGPYVPQSKEKITYADYAGVYVEEEFTPAKTVKLLKAYLKQMEPAEE